MTTNTQTVAAYELSADAKKGIAKAVGAVATGDHAGLLAYVHVATEVVRFLRGTNGPKMPRPVSAAFKRALIAGGVQDALANRLVDRMGHFADPAHRNYQGTGFAAAMLSKNPIQFFLDKGFTKPYQIDLLYKGNKKPVTKTPSEKLAELLGELTDKQVVQVLRKVERAAEIQRILETPAKEPKARAKKAALEATA